MSATDRLIAHQRELIEVQDSLIEKLKATIEKQKEIGRRNQERYLRLARHMESCSNIGETTRAKWENFRLNVEEKR